MNELNSDFRLLKVKNGKPFFAIINIEVTESQDGNEVIENYSGEGWKGQGSIESVPIKGYEDWKEAVKKGLEFVFSKSVQKWKVKINKVEGRVMTDTNPTIVGFTTILAFCEQTNLKLDDSLKSQLEEFTFRSWENKNDEKIPNFINLQYDI